MAKDDKFDMPAQMWAFADKSVEQAKTAFDTFVVAAQQAVPVHTRTWRRPRIPSVPSVCARFAPD